MRSRLAAKVEPIPYPDYRRRGEADSCLHDPFYPVGLWRCPLKRGHADFHRYYPLELLEFDGR